MFRFGLSAQHGPKLRRARWPLAVGVAALVPMLLLAAQGQGDKDSATVSRGAAEVSVQIGEAVYVGFAGTPAQEPTQTAECMVGGIGQKSAWSSPTWKWHFTSKRIPATPTPAPGGTSTTPGGTSTAPGAPAAPAPDEGSVTEPDEDMKQTVSSGTTFTATQAGDYEVTASVVVAYSADCKTGAPTSGELKGQNTTIVHVGTNGDTTGSDNQPNTGPPNDSTEGEPPATNPNPGTPPTNPGDEPDPTVTPAPVNNVNLTADNPTWHSVDLNWTKFGGESFSSYKLYRSTENNFTPGETNYIGRGELEGQVAKLDYKDGSVLPDTTYHYVLRVTHGSESDDAKAQAKTPDLETPNVTFDDQLARACAGGIGVDGIHSFTITGTAKRKDENGQDEFVPAGTEFTLTFEGNKGHDYSGDDEGIKPVGWKTEQIKRAKFVTVDEQGNQKLVEELKVTTSDSTKTVDGKQVEVKGQFSVTVLSSDVISSGVQIKVKWVNTKGEKKEAGDKSCSFEQAEYRRRFANPFNSAEPYPEADNGWLIQSRWLSESQPTTTCKVYLKFKRDPKGEDEDGNWDFVSGHQMLFKIESVDTKDDSSAEETNDYVKFASTSDSYAFAPTVPKDGAATAILQAGTQVDKVKTIHIVAHDESQWSS